MISVICVYNNEFLLNNFLLKSLKNQTKHELILVDNTKHEFSSYARAANKASIRARGNYLMFVHQDIDLTYDSCLEEIEHLSDSVEHLGVAGVAGRSETSSGVVTNIMHGTPRFPAGQVQIMAPTEVQTVDSCLIVVPKAVFHRVQFDERAVRGWHLLAEDYCLTIGNLGFRTCVLPIALYHKSTGNPPPLSYYTSLLRLLSKHRRYKVVYTTSGCWSLKNYVIDLLKHIYVHAVRHKRR